MKYFFNLLLIIIIFLTSSLTFADSKHYLDFSGIDFSEDTSKKIKKVQKVLEKGANEIRAIGLSKNKITTDIFSEITEKFVSLDNIKGLKILDLEDNYIDEESAKDIASWLEKAPDLIINLYDTRLSLKYINKLFFAFRENFSLDVTKTFMKRIIFMSKGYVNKAKKNVQVYKNFVSQEIIPVDWDSTHNRFYKSADFKELLKIREEERNYEVINRIKMIGQLSPNKPTEVSKKIDFKGDSSVSDSVLINALKSLSITHSK